MLIADLGEAVPISLSRSYHYHTEGTPHANTLCGFCDASVQAVVYLVMESDVSTDVNFMVAFTAPNHTPIGITLCIPIVQAYLLRCAGV